MVEGQAAGAFIDERLENIRGEYRVFLNGNTHAKGQLPGAYLARFLDGIFAEVQIDVTAAVKFLRGAGAAASAASLRFDADVVLVHSRKGEDQFVADRHAKERFDVMYNDFIVLAPKADPARVSGMSTGKEAFKAIMDAKATFASRGDKSGTNTKELSIWSSLGVTPTKELAWYKSLGQGMGETLIFANEQGAYTLSDRGTYLSMKNKLPNLVVAVGGNTIDENKDKSLLNPYGVLAVDPAKNPGVKHDLAMQFVEWITSVEEQQKIGEFGKGTFGQSLFYPSSAEWKAAHPN